MFEEHLLQRQPPLIGVEHQRLVLLEVGCDVALTVGNRLLAYILGRRLAQVAAGNLDVVAEDLVEAHLEVLDIQPLTLSALEVGDPILGAAAALHQVVKLIAVAVAHHARRVKRRRRLLHQRRFEQRAQRLARRQRVGRQRGRADVSECCMDGGHARQHFTQPHQVARQRQPGHGAAAPALKVTDALEQCAQRQAQVGCAVKERHTVEARVDGVHVEQGLAKAATQKACAHGR